MMLRLTRRFFFVQNHKNINHQMIHIPSNKSNHDEYWHMKNQSNSFPMAPKESNISSSSFICLCLLSLPSLRKNIKNWSTSNGRKWRESSSTCMKFFMLLPDYHKNQFVCCFCVSFESNCWKTILIFHKSICLCA